MPQPNDPLGMFDRVSNGGHTDLLSYLWAKFAVHLEEKLAERAAKGLSAVTLEQAQIAVPTSRFLEWAKTFLEHNPAVETYASGGNYGVRLADGTYVVINPNDEDIEPGSMQESAAIPVMQPRRNA